MVVVVLLLATGLVMPSWPFGADETSAQVAPTQVPVCREGYEALLLAGGRAAVVPLHGVSDRDRDQSGDSPVLPRRAAVAPLHRDGDEAGDACLCRHDARRLHLRVWRLEAVGNHVYPLGHPLRHG
ncbi:MAG: hypothetical protein F4236_01690 [Acidimicrobiia bacterium]|nr:hypothetical protein [Acidimicrobiia bacterium]MYJ13659.1 hypothetical protein [Acidimicrobiia bacterium]